MNTEKDVMTVAAQAGQRVLVAAHAQGGPARTLAYGTAAAVVAVGTGIAYGACKYGGKTITLLRG